MFENVAQNWGASGMFDAVLAGVTSRQEEGVRAMVDPWKERPACLLKPGFGRNPRKLGCVHSDLRGREFRNIIASAAWEGLHDCKQGNGATSLLQSPDSARSARGRVSGCSWQVAPICGDNQFPQGGQGLLRGQA